MTRRLKLSLNNRVKVDFLFLLLQMALSDMHLKWETGADIKLTMT